MGAALGEELAASSSFSGDGLHWRSFVIAGIGFVRLRLPGEQEEYFGPRFHCKMLGSQMCLPEASSPVRTVYPARPRRENLQLKPGV